eukprot:1763527-Rhodomonas_salina.1
MPPTASLSLLSSLSLARTVTHSRVDSRPHFLTRGRGCAGRYIVEPSLTLRRIAQDNPFALAANTLTATLKFNTDVPEDSEVSISGLSGSSTASAASFPVTILPASNQAFKSAASWNIGGTLVIVATSFGAVSGTQYTVSWTLTNGGAGQPSPSVVIGGFVNTAPGFENGALTESQFEGQTMKKPGELHAHGDG